MNAYLELGCGSYGVPLRELLPLSEGLRKERVSEPRDIRKLSFLVVVAVCGYLYFYCTNTKAVQV